MAVIAVVGNKGGAGKTTLAVNLAATLATNGRTVVLDADPQGSALQWQSIAATGAEPKVIDTASGLEEIFADTAVLYEHVVIDCPPSVHAAQTHAALAVCDIALIPVQPSPLDLWATVHIEQAVEKARGSNPAIRALLVINQLEPRTRLSRLIREALAELELPAAETAIRRRAVYRASVLEGRSVLDMGRSGAAAAAEIRSLINEVVTQ
ncbi:MAG: ParA family partition ATPase [Gammaproteobacteria bacterium]|jgi:chromosome partitioning protein